MESIGLPRSETPEIGEGGPRPAYSPAVAGGGPHVLLVVGMRGHFRALDDHLPARKTAGRALYGLMDYTGVGKW